LTLVTNLKKMTQKKTTRVRVTVLKKARNPIKIARTIKPTKRKRIRMVVKSLTRKLKKMMMTKKTQRRMEMRRKISKKVLVIRRMIRR